MTKILVLDIETAPNIAYVWRMFKENIGVKQVKEHSTIMSFACKWLEQKDVFYFSADRLDETALVKALLKFLDEADIVIAHNGDRFDLPTIQGRALVLGLTPPSPYRTIDTLKSARYEFKFGSNSLEALSSILKVEEKDSHKKFPGFELWSECLKGNPEAWEEMRQYNIQDVITLEQVYLKMRPFMRRHPNIPVLNDSEELACPKCGSNHIHRRGFTTTNTGKYQRFVCNNCGGWSRTRYTENSLEKRKSLLSNVS